MTKATRLTVFVLVLAAGCWAQNSLTVQVKGRQKSSAEEVDRLYLSACSAVQREVGGTRPVRPRLTLVLGADKDEADLDRREIRLIKWNPFLFAEGVVVFAFDDLMPGREDGSCQTRSELGRLGRRYQNDLEIEKDPRHRGGLWH